MVKAPVKSKLSMYRVVHELWPSPYEKPYKFHFFIWQFLIKNESTFFYSYFNTVF
eukprot:SAG11_NODE_6385_length_1323_cov_6.759804_1_plen_54_part_01